MERYDIINYIRDEMLRDPNIEASFCYESAKLALEDNEIYNLMSSWMEETSPRLRKYIEEEMEDILSYHILGCNGCLE